MKKNENTAKENKDKESEKWFQAGDVEALYEMINTFCRGQHGIPDCCSEMKKR